VNSLAGSKRYPAGIRDQQEVIIGGSAAPTRTDRRKRTIGYFVRVEAGFSAAGNSPLKQSHVFADLRKTSVDESDLIMQPIQVKPAGNRPIGALVNFFALKFDDIKAPNHVDAAIAKLWAPLRHEPLIPFNWHGQGYVQRRTLNGEAVASWAHHRLYEGRVFSIALDIWIRYDRTGNRHFSRTVSNRADLPDCTKFVSRGDSGSLLVDAEQHAIGLIFAACPSFPPRRNRDRVCRAI